MTNPARKDALTSCFSVDSPASVATTASDRRSDGISAPCKGDMFFAQLVGPTLGRVATLDARGRSPHVRSGRPPIVGPRGRGSLPRLPAVGDGVRRSRSVAAVILPAIAAIAAVATVSIATAPAAAAIAHVTVAAVATVSIATAPTAAAIAHVTIAAVATASIATAPAAAAIAPV